MESERLRTPSLGDANTILTSAAVKKGRSRQVRNAGHVVRYERAAPLSSRSSRNARRGAERHGHDESVRCASDPANFCKVVS